MTTMQTKTPAQLADAFISAFNTADWEQLRAIIAPNVVYTETGTQRRVENRENYLQVLQEWKQVMPDALGTVHKTISEGNIAVQKITWSGTQTGPLALPAGTLPATGKEIRVQAAVWYTLEGEMAQEVHHYLDVMALLQQLGALPG